MASTPSQTARRIVLQAAALGALRLAHADARAFEPKGRGLIAMPGRPQLDGSFIQLWERHLSWTREDWSALLDAFVQLDLPMLIVQWSRHDDLRYAESPSRDDARKAPLAHLAWANLARPIPVLLGLDHHSGWWRHAELSGAKLRALLDQWVARALLEARRLRPFALSLPGFQGWYLTEEIDVHSWAPQQRLEALGHALSRICAGLEQLTPGLPIALSGFGDARDSLGQTAAFWRAIWARAPRLDCLLLQDGIGVGHYRIDQWAETLAADRTVLGAAPWPRRARQRPALWAVVETFRQHSAPGAPFAARPAPIAELALQLEIASQADRRIAFSAPDYMMGPSGSKADRLNRDYRARYRRAV